MNINHLPKLIIICCISVVAANIAEAQQTRSIKSDDFASQRPVETKTATNRKRPKNAKRFTYKYVRRDESAIRWRTGQKEPTRKPVTANLPAKVSEIGVTGWKLR